MNTRAKILVEKLLSCTHNALVRYKSQRVTESTSYRIVGGRTFSSLSKLDLEIDGLQLVLVIPANKITPAQRRKVADAVRSKLISWKPFDTEGNATVPANFESFNPSKEYALFDGMSYAHVTFDRKSHRVVDATRFGANEIEDMLPELGRDAICEIDSDYCENPEY